MELNRTHTYHIIGIGGTGMSAIAVVLHEMGYDVQGSDQNDSPAIKRLRDLGIRVTVGHDAANLDGADVVLYSSAVHPDNPEFAAAQLRGLPAFKRSQFLTALLDGRKTVAVAGTHGKTTTTSMLAWMMSALNLAPGFIIGSTPKNLGTNAAAGKSDLFIIEADEYDRMFHGLRPDIAILTRIEADHPDCFPTVADYNSAFIEFFNGCKPGAIILSNSADRAQPALLAASSNQLKIKTYGTELTDDYRMADFTLLENGCNAFRFIVTETGQSVQVNMNIHGRHNCYNACAALAALHENGIDIEAAAQKLSEFSGIARRFEIIAESVNTIVIDDYAHHPTEIRATIRAARDAFPERKIWTLWQPHTYSRTKELLNEFVTAFSESDWIVVTNIYAAREKETDFGFADLKKALRKEVPNAIFAETNERAVELLTIGVQSGDVILTCSAGDANKIGPEVLKRQEAIVHNRDKASEIPAPEFERNIAVYANAHVGGPADELYVVKTTGELHRLIEDAQHNRIPVKVVGGLTNTLFDDAGFRGRLIINQSRDILIRWQTVNPESNKQGAEITVDAGLPLHDLVRATVAFNLTGLEWATRIPGSVGGAVYGNAGAYGSEIKNSLIRIDYLNENGYLDEMTVDELELAYRSSIFKSGMKKGVIIRAVFRLEQGNVDEIEAKYNEIWEKREKFNFKNQGSLGSVFRNPTGDYSGRLITECGLRSATVGGAMVTDFHGNIFVTNPGATANDFKQLVQKAHDAVLEKFGIDLRTEIEFVPETPAPQPVINEGEAHGTQSVNPNNETDKGN